MKTLCPMYSYAGDMSTWAARIAQLHPGDIAVVVSGNNGPMPISPDLLGHITELHAKGILTFGYVHVSYGARPIGEVLTDITTWRTQYGVRRIFLDEWNPIHHAELGVMWGGVRGRVVDAERRAGPYLIANPGGPVTWPSVPDGTLVITHESPVPPPVNHSPLPWEAAIIHSHPEPQYVRDHLAALGWQWGYCTSDGPDGNPYDQAGA